MIPVKLVMNKDVVSVRFDTPIQKAAEIMQENRVGCLLVKCDGENVGILTEADIVQKVVAAGLDPTKISVQKVMSAPLITIEGIESVVAADELMERHRIRHLVVMEDGKAAGIVSVRDLLFPLQYLLVFADVDLAKQRGLLDDESSEVEEIGRQIGRRRKA